MAKIHEELEKAEKKHPNWPQDRLRQAAIIAEEGGEVLQAALTLIEEAELPQETREKANKLMSSLEDNLLKEVLQTAAMAFRFLFNYTPRYETRPEQTS